MLRFSGTMSIILIYKVSHSFPSVLSFPSLTLAPFFISSLICDKSHMFNGMLRIILYTLFSFSFYIIFFLLFHLNHVTNISAGRGIQPKMQNTKSEKLRDNLELMERQLSASNPVCVIWKGPSRQELQVCTAKLKEKPQK